MRPDPDAALRHGSAAPVGPAAIPRGDLLFSAVAAAPLPMAILDPHAPGAPVVLANAAFSRLTGRRPAEIVGRDLAALLEPDPDAVERLRQAIRSPTGLAVALLGLRGDGTPVRGTLHLSPVLDAGGDLALVLASLSAPSPAASAEDGQASPEPSAARVAGIAHDLRNMLQVITGCLDDGEGRAAATGDTRSIRRARAAAAAAARAAALADELQEIARGGSVEARGPFLGPEAAGPPRGEIGAPTPGARVLVVDDRAEIAELARAMLESLGYRVEVAGDAQAALDRLPAGFDLLFTDLLMPGPLDGLGLAREARRRHPGLKVLLTTGDPDRAADRADGFGTIVKPYRRADLADRIRRALEGPSGPHEP